MTDLTLKPTFTDRGGAQVYDVYSISASGEPYTFGQVRLKPDPKLEEMREEILERDVRIEKLEGEKSRQRWNIEEVDGELIICRGTHSKGDHCEEHDERWVPCSRIEVLEGQRKAVLELPKKWDEVYEHFAYLNPHNLRKDIRKAAGSEGDDLA
jgi:hypothetical protein